MSNPLPNTLRQSTFLLLSDLRVWTRPVTGTDGGGLIMMMTVIVIMIMIFQVV